MNFYKLNKQLQADGWVRDTTMDTGFAKFYYQGDRIITITIGADYEVTAAEESVPFDLSRFNHTPNDETVLECFLDGAAGEFVEEDFNQWLAEHDEKVRKQS